MSKITKQIVKCPKCKREIVTEKNKGIKCRKCYVVFDLELGYSLRQ